VDDLEPVADIVSDVRSGVSEILGKDREIEEIYRPVGVEIGTRVERGITGGVCVEGFDEDQEI
jgi:hypothetical protein